MSKTTKVVRSSQNTPANTLSSSGFSSSSTSFPEVTKELVELYLDALEKAGNFDLSELWKEDNNIDAAISQEQVESFKEFMAMKVAVNDMRATILCPPVAISKVWQVCLLHPMLYVSFCDAILPPSVTTTRVIGHDPSDNEESSSNSNSNSGERQERLKATLTLYRKLVARKHIWLETRTFSPILQTRQQVQTQTQTQQQMQQQQEQTGVGMQIFVNGLKGVTIILNVNSSDLVEDVKKMMQERQGPPPCIQRLIYGGRQLEDGHTLSKCNIGPKATLFLVLRLGGC